MLFSHFSVILTIVKNEWLATKGQIAILSNFEVYYIYDLLSDVVLTADMSPYFIQNWNISLNFYISCILHKQDRLLAHTSNFYLS